MQLENLQAAEKRLTQETPVSKEGEIMNGNWKTISCTVALALTLVSVDAFGGVCPSGALAKPKSSAMYLVYLSSDDATFPEYNAGPDPTSPLSDFDITELDATIGTEAQLRTAVQELVEDGYCEFDVEVKTFTGASLPSPTETRWQIVGLGTGVESPPRHSSRRYCLFQGDGAFFIGEYQIAEQGRLRSKGLGRPAG